MDSKTAMRHLNEMEAKLKLKKDALLAKINAKLEKVQAKKIQVAKTGPSDTASQKTVVSTVSSVSTVPSVVSKVSATAGQKGGSSQWKGPSQAHAMSDMKELYHYGKARIDNSPMFNYSGNGEFATPTSGVYLESQCWTHTGKRGAEGFEHGAEHFEDGAEGFEHGPVHNATNVAHAMPVHHATHHGAKHSSHHGNATPATNFGHAGHHMPAHGHADVHSSPVHGGPVHHGNVAKHGLTHGPAHHEHTSAPAYVMPHHDSPVAPHINGLQKHKERKHGHPEAHALKMNESHGPVPANEESVMEKFESFQDPVTNELNPAHSMNPMHPTHTQSRHKDMNINVYVHEGQPQHKKKHHGFGHALGHTLGSTVHHLRRFPHLVGHPIFGHVNNHLQSQPVDCPPMHFETEVLADGKHKLSIRLMAQARPMEFIFNSAEELHAVFQHMKQIHPGKMTHCHLQHKNMAHLYPQQHTAQTQEGNLNHLFQ